MADVTISSLNPLTPSTGLVLPVSNGSTTGRVTLAEVCGVMTSSQIVNALGYTPYNGTTNPNGYISTIPPNSITPAMLTRPFTQIPAVNANTGTDTVEITGIASWASRVTLVVSNFINTGAGGGSLRIQLGSPGGYKTSGYNGGNSAITTSTAGASLIQNDSYFVIGNFGAYHGQFDFIKISSNTWVCRGAVSGSTNISNNRTSFVNGSVTLDSTLDKIKIMTSIGVFSGGEASIQYQ